MKRSRYLPSGNAQKGIWLSNFNNILTPTLAAKLGISTKEKASLIADTLVFMYSLVLTEASKTFEHQCVAFQSSLCKGINGTDNVAIPVLEIVGVAPASVPTGIFKRVGIIVKKIKLSSNYTEDIGKALGIIGSELDSKSIQDELCPKLSGKMVAGKVQIKYVRRDNDGIKLESRRGTETQFSLLDKINKSTYTDKRPNLVKGQPEEREYRAWFFKDDEVIGQVSAVITVNATA